MKFKGTKLSASYRANSTYPSPFVVVALVLVTTFNILTLTDRHVEIILALTSTITPLETAVLQTALETHPIRSDAVPTKTDTAEAIGADAVPTKTRTAQATSSLNPTAAPTSKLQRYLQVTDGGIHACARFTTRYEAPHLIQWLYYHKRVGISFFHLYFDKISSNFTNAVEEKAYNLASKLPFVKIYDIEEMGLALQGMALRHCLDEAHLPMKAEWIVDFDIDEVFAFGDPVVTQKCDNDKEYLQEGALSKFTANLPRTVLGIILPRIPFGQNGVKVPPTNSLQMQLYTRRNRKVSWDGKVMRRVVSDGTIEQYSKHDFLAKGRESGIYPNGKPAHLLNNCTEDTDMCTFHMEGSDNMSAKQIDLRAKEHLSFPRLHHYASRSLQDCLRKLADCNTPRAESLVISPWRKAENACAEDKDNQVEDFSLYCASMKVSAELRQLFPSLDNEPRVF